MYVSKLDQLESALNAADEAEALVRQFAVQFPTPNVLKGLAYCESGRIAWADMARLAEEALTAAVQAA